MAVVAQRAQPFECAFAIDGRIAHVNDEELRAEGADQSQRCFRIGSAHGVIARPLHGVRQHMFRGVADEEERFHDHGSVAMRPAACARGATRLKPPWINPADNADSPAVQ